MPGTLLILLFDWIPKPCATPLLLRWCGIPANIRVHQPDNLNDQDAETTKTMMLFSVVLASLSHSNASWRSPAPKEFLFRWFYFGDGRSESQLVWPIIRQPVHWCVQQSSFRASKSCRTCDICEWICQCPVTPCMYVCVADITAGRTFSPHNRAGFVHDVVGIFTHQNWLN